MYLFVRRKQRHETAYVSFGVLGAGRGESVARCAHLAVGGRRNAFAPTSWSSSRSDSQTNIGSLRVRVDLVQRSDEYKYKLFISPRGNILFVDDDKQRFASTLLLLHRKTHERFPVSAATAPTQCTRNSFCAFELSQSSACGKLGVQ